MTVSAIAARLIDALEAAADREAGARTVLVSVAIDMTAPGADGEIRAALTRKTRTLVFMSATFVGAAGETIATASSVHKIPA